MGLLIMGGVAAIVAALQGTASTGWTSDAVALASASLALVLARGARRH